MVKPLFVRSFSRRLRCLLGVLLLSIYCAGLLFAQTAAPDQIDVEADIPTNILKDLELDDDDVQLTVEGSWESEFALGFSWLFHPPLPGNGATVTPNYPFPGLAIPPLLANTIDMTIVLWLYEKYFIRITLIDEQLDANSYVIGYQGAEEDAVQLAQLGYGHFEISPYRYLPSRAVQPTPGLSLDLQTTISRHELLLRLEGSQPQRTRFIGSRRVNSNRIGLGDYIQGRFFVLPDSGISDLRLYIEAHNGAFAGDDGRFYNLVNPEDYGTLSAATGLLELYEMAHGRLLVYYRANGSEVGSRGNGRATIYARDSRGYIDVLQPARDFDFDTPAGSAYRVGVDGRDALLIYAPGSFSPFENLNRYDVSGQRLGDLVNGNGQAFELAFVQQADGTEQTIEGRSLSLSPSGNEIVVSDADNDQRYHTNRYPFAASQPAFPEIYGDGPQRPAGYSMLDIEIRRLDAPGTASLPPDAVPGSWIIQRNGVVDSAIIIDPLTGEIIGLGTETDSDVIDLTYRSIAEQGGELVFGSGNRFFIDDALMLEVALGARWALLTDRFSSIADEYPGSLLLSTRLVYEAPTIAAEVSGALQLYVADTSGHLRLLGMEEQQTEPPISATSLFPAPAPATMLSGRRLTDADRGMLLYRDYIGDSGGLQEYDRPNVERFPYEEGGRIGPYPASARGDGRGPAMVLDYVLETNEWVAGMVRISDGADVDLSGLNALSFQWRALDPTDGADDLDIYLQIGAIGEDLDNDGVLDEGESILRPNFDFNDRRRAFDLRVGPQIRAISTRLSEDGNRNGLLDREDADLIYTSRELATSYGGLPQNSWRQVHIVLDTEQRRMLRHSRALRIVVLNGSLRRNEGRMLFSDIQLHGSTLVVEREIGQISVYEQAESGDNALTSAFPEVATRFHGGSAGGQRVLRIDWQSGGSPDWELRDLVAATPSDYYRNLVLYLRVAELEVSPTGAQLEIELTDRPADEAGAAGIAAVIDLGRLGNRWHKLELSPGSGDVNLDGENIGRLRRNNGGGALLRYLTIRQRGAESGLLFLDELHWADSQPLLDGAAGVRFEWLEPQALLTSDDFVLFGNIALYQEANIRSRGFGRGAGVAVSQRLYDSHTRVGFDILGIHLDTNLDIAGEAGTDPAIEIGHALRIPAATSPVVFTERYRRSYNTPVASFQHTNALLFDLDHIGSWRLDADVTSSNGSLRQRWGALQESRWDFPIQLDWRLDIGHDSRNYQLGEDGYFEAWIESFALYLPYSDGTMIARSIELAPEVRLGTEDAHLRLNSDLGYRNETDLSGLQYDDVDLVAALPLRFDDDWALTPSYSRRLTLSGDAPTNDDYGDDLDLYFRRIGRQDYLFGGLPFVELLDPRLVEQVTDRTGELQRATYRPRAAVALARRFGSNLIDLFLPSSVELSMERALAIATEQSDRLTWSALFSTSALNLFGSLGAYPLASIYATDQFISTLALSLIGDRERIGWEAALSNRFGFFAIDQSRLELNNRLELEQMSQEERLQVTLQSGAELEWDGGSYELFDVEDFRLVHTESLQFALYPEANGFEEHLFTVIAGHETSLRFPPSDDFEGQIGAFMRMGIGLQPIDNAGRRDNLTLLGLQFGLRGRIAF